jgi:hypothetical protein
MERMLFDVTVEVGRINDLLRGNGGKNGQNNYRQQCREEVSIF